MSLSETKKALLLLHAVASFMLLISLANSSLTLTFNNFQSNMTDVKYEGDAYASNGQLQLTQLYKDNCGNITTNSVGHFSYDKPVRLRDNATGTTADFSSDFYFNIQAADALHGDGLAFFLAPFDFAIPSYSYGGSLGLFSEVSTDEVNSRNNVVAIEIDRFQNDFDPSADHVGIDVKSVVSVASTGWTSVDPNRSFLSGRANVTYNSTLKELKVCLTDINVMGNVTTNLVGVSYEIDLGQVLPEQVRVGFSASTGSYVETHAITSWNFYSSLS